MPAIIGALADRLTVEVSHGSVFDDVRRGSIRAIALRHTNLPETAGSLLNRYRQAGAVALHERTEDCAVILFDAESRQLVLCRDRLGLNPLHYFEHEGRFYFGSLIRELLHASGKSARPDLGALALVFGAGAALPTDATYFDGVRTLPPGATLVYQSGRLQILSPDAVAAHGSAAHFCAAFDNAVRMRLSARSRTAVLVSGGLDSAAILTAAEPARAFGITYGLEDGSAADESRYVEMLRATGRDIVRVPFYPSADMASMEANVLHGEVPFVDLVPATMARAAAVARAEGADILLLGTWGDQVLAPFPPPHLRQIAPWRLVKLRLLARQYQRSMTDVRTAYIMELLLRQSLRARLPHAGLRARRKKRAPSTFDLLQRSAAHDVAHEPPVSFADAVRRATLWPDPVLAIEGTVKWGWGQALEVRLPFLDLQLLRLLLAVPDEAAYRDHTLKPLLRDVLRGRVPEALSQRGDKGDYTAAIQRGLPPVPEIVAALDGLRRPVAFGLMSESAAAKTLARFQRGPDIADDDRELARRLLGLDIWLRLFFEGE